MLVGVTEGLYRLLEDVPEGEKEPLLAVAENVFADTDLEREGEKLALLTVLDPLEADQLFVVLLDCVRVSLREKVGVLVHPLITVLDGVSGDWDRVRVGVG